MYTTSWRPIKELQEGVGYRGFYAAIAIDNNNYVHVVWESDGYHTQEAYHLVYERFTTFWEPYESISIIGNNPVGRVSIAVESGVGNSSSPISFDPYEKKSA